MRIVPLVGLTSLVAAAMACSSAVPENAPVESTHTTVESLSIVTFAADGTWSLKVEHPSREGLSVDALTVAASCNAPLEAFFDQPVGAASANELCFSGTGSIDLATVPKASGGTWADSIQSYLTQANSGYVSLDAPGYDDCAPFGVSTSQTNLAGSDAARAYLTVGPAACPVPPPPVCTSQQWLCRAECPSGLVQRCVAKSSCPATPPGVSPQNYCCEHELRCL